MAFCSEFVNDLHKIAYSDDNCLRWLTDVC